MCKLCDKDCGRTILKMKLPREKLKKVSTTNSWKNVLMEIQCAMPVKAVEIFLPHVCHATLIFRFSSEYFELPDVKN